jgi:hypothetical protein
MVGITVFYKYFLRNNVFVKILSLWETGSVIVFILKIVWVQIDLRVLDEILRKV